MGTVPTGEMERELRKEYLRWLAGLDRHQEDLQDYISAFEAKSRATIAKFGGQAASLGAPADFPTPKLLELSPVADVVYDEMQQAAVKASIIAGLNSTDAARQMLYAGLGKSFNRLNRLARTETVSAYWKNSWDAVADLPLIVMVWSSESSKRTCDWCLSRDGLVVEDSNIRDHPQGRCTLIPTLRSRLKYKGTLEPDGSVTMDPRYMDQKVKGAKAMESAGPSTEEQRDPLSGKRNPAAPSVAQPVHQSTGPVVKPAPAKLEVPSGTTTVQVKTVKMPDNPDFELAKKDGIAGGDWRFIEDRSQRAVVLLQNDYRAEQAVKAVAKNLREGKEAFDGVKTNSAYFKAFEGRPRDLKYTHGAPAFTAADVKDAIQDAAQWLLEQEQVKKRTLFKGLDIPSSKMGVFKEGGTFDVNYSSFSADDSVAYRYTSPANRVVVKITNGSGVELKDKDNVSNFGGKSAAHKEVLLTGQGTITKIEKTGGVTWIHVKL